MFLNPVNYNITTYTNAGDFNLYVSTLIEVCLNNTENSLLSQNSQQLTILRKCVVEEPLMFNSKSFLGASAEWKTFT